MVSGCSTTLARVLIKNKGKQDIQSGYMYSLSYNVTPTVYRGG